jgi:DNA-binding MarR family transcriptional regulator
MPTAADTVPLVTLLGGVEAAFAAEFDRRIAGTEIGDLSLAHARNVLRHLSRGPLRASQLVSRSGVSKQALSQQIGHLERAGYVAVDPDPSDHRARIVALTERGDRARQLVRRVFRQIERDWARELPDGDLERVHAVLTTVLVNRGRGSSCC